MTARRLPAALCLLVAFSAACNRAEESRAAAGGLGSAAIGGANDRGNAASAAGDAGVSGRGAGAGAAAPGVARGPRVVFLGDSLTAGLGLAVEQAYPALLGEQLAEEGLPITVVNAGVSGDTTAGGLARLGWILREPADVVVVCLGGNDGLRGQSTANIEGNLRQIIQRVQATGARVLLLGVPLPTNYGADYRRAFDAIFPALAEELQVPLVPSLLEGVGGLADLNQSDGIHPTAEGQQRAARNVLPALRALLAGE